MEHNRLAGKPPGGRKDNEHESACSCPSVEQSLLSTAQRREVVIAGRPYVGRDHRERVGALRVIGAENPLAHRARGKLRSLRHTPTGQNCRRARPRMRKDVEQRGLAHAASAMHNRNQAGLTTVVAEREIHVTEGGDGRDSSVDQVHRRWRHCS